MGNERYELDISSDMMAFEFTSVGPKGKISKLVIYSETGIKGLYNLGFGDNKDSVKVLATVASTIYAFMTKYPNAAVAATGSTSARTRLYQMGISNNLEEICKDFNVFGRIERFWYPFEKNIAYNAFLVTSKKNKIWKI